MYRTRRTERPPLIKSSHSFLAWCLVHRSLILQQQQHQPPPQQEEEEDVPPKCRCVRPNVAAAAEKNTASPCFFFAARESPVILLSHGAETERDGVIN